MCSLSAVTGEVRLLLQFLMFPRPGCILELLSPELLSCLLSAGLTDCASTACASLVASMVLDDQTALRLAQKQEKRTDWVMNQWGSRNGRVSELVNLLEGLELLRPRDVILKGGLCPPA